MKNTSAIRLAALLAAGCSLAASGVQGSDDAATLGENEALLRAWQQQNVGGPAPELVASEGGGTQIVWSGNVSVDAYVNSVSSAGGNVMTPFKSGRFAKSVVQSDLRGTGRAGDTSFFQVGWTSSNDRAVLSQYPQQINNLQIGRSGENYLLALGDVAPNYSSLSTALGARGVMGQVKLGEVSLSAFAGVVAQSWEALGGQVPRNQYLRDVHGGKVEYALLPSLKVYLTAQGASDRAASIPAGSSYTQPKAIRSQSGGFQFQEGGFQASGEYAHGGSGDQGGIRNEGDATLLDASWRLEKWSFRAGYHELDTGFYSLSGMVQPGIVESYLNADWTAASWLSLSGEKRNTRNRTAAINTDTYSVPATTAVTDSETLRANLNFGPNLPGWGSSFQQSRSKTKSPQNTLSRNDQSSGQLNFYSPKVNASVGYGIGNSHNEASPDYDSQSTSWQLSFARNYSDATPTSGQTWSLGLNFNGALQKQAMVNGSANSNFNYSIGLNGQRDGWGSLQIGYTGGITTQPYGAPELRQLGLTLDASKPLPGNASVKLYVRDNQRNLGSPLMETRETVSGLQYSSPF